MKWNKQLLLVATTITETMHGSAIGFFEEVEGKRKVVHICAW
jgi:hypothetical protein